MTPTTEELAEAFKTALNESALRTSIDSLKASLEDCICKEAPKESEAAAGAGVTDDQTAEAEPVPPPENGNEAEVTSGELDKANTKSVKLSELLEKGLGKTGELLAAVQETMEAAQEAVFDSTDFIVRIDNGIQKFAGNVRFSQFAMSDLAKSTQRVFEGTLKEITDIGQKSLDANSKTAVDIIGGTQSSLQFLYGVGEEAIAEAESDMASFYNSSRVESEKFFAALESEQVAVSLSIGKALNISTSDQAELVELSIARTGKATTDIIEEVGAYAVQLQKTTGISSKTAAAGIIALQKDMETFGDIGTDAAARITGALTNLGVSMQGFSGLVSKFMNFDSAVSAIGDLTSAFGLQLDAMELFKLANEDEEEFLKRIREEFQSQGIAVDDLNKAQLKLIKDATGLSDIKDVKNFLREGSAGFDELAAATEDVDVGGSFDEVIAQGVPARKTVKDFGEAMQAQAMLEGAERIRGVALNFDAVATNAGRASSALQPFYNMMNDKAMELAETGVSAVNKAIQGDYKGAAAELEVYAQRQKDIFLGTISEIKAGLSDGSLTDAFKDGLGGKDAEPSSVLPDIMQPGSPSPLGWYIFKGLTDPQLTDSYVSFMEKTVMTSFEAIENAYDTSFYPMIETKFESFQMTLLDQIKSNEVDFLSTLIDTSLQSSAQNVVESLNQAQVDIVTNAIDSIGLDTTKTTESVIAASGELNNSIEELKNTSLENITHQKQIADNSNQMIISLSELIAGVSSLKEALATPSNIENRVVLNLDGKVLADSVINNGYSDRTGNTIPIVNEYDVG